MSRVSFIQMRDDCLLVVFAKVLDDGRMVHELAALALQAGEVHVYLDSCVHVCLVQ